MPDLRFIQTSFENNEGFGYPRTEADIQADLVQTVNQLIAYLGERDGLEPIRWTERAEIEGYHLPEKEKL